MPLSVTRPKNTQVAAYDVLHTAMKFNMHMRFFVYRPGLLWPAPSQKDPTP